MEGLAGLCQCETWRYQNALSCWLPIKWTKYSTTIPELSATGAMRRMKVVPYGFRQCQMPGLRYFAWIQSPGLFSQLSALNSLNAMIENAEISIFDNIEEAQQWLDSKG